MFSKRDFSKFFALRPNNSWKFCIFWMILEPRRTINTFMIRENFLSVSRHRLSPSWRQEVLSPLVTAQFYLPPPWRRKKWNEWKGLHWLSHLPDLVPKLADWKYWSPLSCKFKLFSNIRLQEEMSNSMRQSWSRRSLVKTLQPFVQLRRFRNYAHLVSFVWHVIIATLLHWFVLFEVSFGSCKLIILAAKLSSLIRNHETLRYDTSHSRQKRSASGELHFNFQSHNRYELLISNPSGDHIFL